MGLGRREREDVVEWAIEAEKPLDGVLHSTCSRFIKKSHVE